MIGIRDVLKDENVSPNVKRMVLKERAGIPLTEREKKKLKREVVSMVEPPKYHNRIKATTSALKSMEDDEEELDLQELIDELEEELTLEDILKEMGIEDEEEESIDEFNFNSKGYKEATKLVNDLRRGLFRKLNDDELETFMDVLANSFDLKKKYN